MGAVPTLPSTKGQASQAVTDAIDRLATRVLSLESEPTTPTPIPVSPSQLAQVRLALQVNGTHPLNATGLIGVSGSGSGIIIGPSSTRRASQPTPVGQLFFETDRKALYVAAVSGGTNVWLFIENQPFGAALGGLAATLGVNDVGFLFYLAAFDRIYRWNGTVMFDAPQTPPRKELHWLDTAVVPTGFALCNGSVVTISKSDGTTVGGYATPNMIGGNAFARAAASAGATNAFNIQTGGSFTFNTLDFVPMVRL